MLFYTQHLWNKWWKHKRYGITWHSHMHKQKLTCTLFNVRSPGPSVLSTRKVARVPRSSIFISTHTLAAISTCAPNNHLAHTHTRIYTCSSRVRSDCWHRYQVPSCCLAVHLAAQSEERMGSSQWGSCHSALREGWLQTGPDIEDNIGIDRILWCWDYSGSLWHPRWSGSLVRGVLHSLMNRHPRDECMWCVWAIGG